MVTRRSLSWPIFLGVVMIVLVVALIVGWVIVTVSAALSAHESGAVLDGAGRRDDVSWCCCWSAW